MSKLIVKSPYIKNTSKSKMSGHMKYIATRDGVEIIKTEQYLQYIATRPRAEKIGNHGLFGDDKFVDLKSAMAELDNYDGKVWTHIFSLTEQDATRLGYTNHQSWQNLLKTNRNEIAKAMNIPPDNFRWYAAFHAEKGHPHVHMMAWSSNEKEGYLTKTGIEKIKSSLTNDIFKHEMIQLYDEKTMARDSLKQRSTDTLRNMIRDINNGIPNCPEIDEMIMTLSKNLSKTKGKKSYGYLKPADKKLVNCIMDSFQNITIINKSFKEWQELQLQINNYYSSKEAVFKQLSEEKAFYSLKNTIIQQAINIQKFTFSMEAEPTFQSIFDDDKADFTYHELKKAIKSDRFYLDYRDECVEKMEKLAEDGNAFAQYFMGLEYQKSELVLPDVKKSAYYIELASQQNYPLAQFELGRLLLANDTEIRDISRGETWLEKSADLGNESAIKFLAHEYLTGENLEKSVDSAINLYKKLADSGDDFSQYMLGKLLFSNDDVEQSMEYLKLSSEQGNPYAELFSSRIEQNIDPCATLATACVFASLANLFSDNTQKIEQKQRPKMSKKEFIKRLERNNGHVVQDQYEMEGY
ncbi:MAG: MobP3 family relaxase [Clostridia bacterium]